MEIFVFKTNLDNRKQKRKLFPLLRTLQGILKWNIDWEDDDKILRVEAVSVSPRSIESVLRNAGYQCKELED